MTRKILIVFIFMFSMTIEAVKRGETNIDEDVKSFEDAVESLRGGVFRINGEIPYKYESIALLGTPPEEASRRRLQNAINRNNYMMELGLWPENGVGGSAKKALRELKILHSQFDNYTQRNRLDMKKLSESTIPKYQQVKTQLNQKANSLKTEIGQLESKIAKGQLDEKCGFLEFLDCPNNTKRLADKKAELKLHQNRLGKIDTEIGKLQVSVDREMNKQKGSFKTNNDFESKVLGVIKKNKNFVAQEVANLIGAAINANANAIKNNMDELALLKSELNNLKNSVENSMQNVNLQDFNLKLQQSLSSQMEKIKQQWLENACDQAPSCTNQSPLEAIGVHDNSRNGYPLGLGAPNIDYSEYDTLEGATSH